MLKSISFLLVFCTILLNCQEEISTPAIPGSIVDVDLNDPQKYAEIYQQAQFAAKEYTKIFKASLKKSCSRVLFEPVKILSAREQVVAGMLYYIVVEIKDANCQSNCAIKHCEFVTYVVPWLALQQLTESKCV
jgi:hypothetical protein